MLSEESRRHRRLEKLCAQVNVCTSCSLCRTRNRVVFGEGDPDSRLVFIGEAPGAQEDQHGRPFIGTSGKMLMRLLAEIGLQREQVYITSVLKCRPPKNRNPQSEEIAACEPWLRKQLTLLQPRVICALGTFAAQTLLQTREPIGALRGELFTYQGIPLLPTLHPAALLYQRKNLPVAQGDFKKIGRLLET